MQPHARLEGLTAAQRAAVTSDGEPLCILAGPGSGKTRVLTHRIAHRIATGSAEARHVLALTFTRKAAGELRTRLTRLGVRDHVAAGTFHAVAYAQLRQRWSDTGESVPTLLDRKVGLIARLLPRRRDATVQPIDVAGEIEWAKARLVAPDQYEPAATEAGRRPPMPPATLASLYERYEVEKRRRGLVDFDDLLLLCAQVIEADAAYAASQRWRFRHLFVDEFQDVNPVQFRLLEAWRGKRADLCVVGDPDQAIYAWNGADPTLLTGFTRRFPAATIVRLTDNFRSTPQVLQAAERVLATSGETRPRLRAHRAAGPAPTVRAMADDQAEARAIAQALRDQHSPSTPWSHLAVLTRTNGQIALLEEALAATDIPYRVRGGTPFLERPEVRETLARLQRRGGAARPLDVHLADIDLAARNQASSGGEGVDSPAAERRASLLELVRLGHEYLAVEPAGRTAGFLAWLAATVRREAPDRRTDAVELATFHAAKGLEWPVVFLAGLEQGMVPIGHARTPAAIDEERRLLYVAMTRAERELHCSWAAQRTFGTRTSSRSPSPWLDALEADGAAADEKPADWRQRVNRERRRLRSTAGGPGARHHDGAEPDPDVLAALKAWRSRTARAAGVPAYVVFHDTTLTAVAQAKPRSRGDLLGLPGVGPVKAERYGQQLLAVVADHAPAPT